MIGPWRVTVMYVGHDIGVQDSHTLSDFDLLSVTDSCVLPALKTFGNAWRLPGSNFSTRFCTSGPTFVKPQAMRSLCPMTTPGSSAEENAGDADSGRAQVNEVPD